MKLPRWFWIAAFLVCWPTLLFAQPLFALSENGVVITLTDEPCQLDGVANLPFKATWEESGKTFPGCWAVAYDKERVNFFFMDKSVVSFHPVLFKKLTGV